MDVHEPWLLDAGEVAGRLSVDPAVGLSGDEAATRLAQVGPNRLEVRPSSPQWRKLLRQFADPLVGLLLAAVVISLLTWALDGADGVPFEALVILVILVANAILGHVQERRAERAVEALQRMAAATSTVLRDGVQRRIIATEVVPGDVLLLAEGDAVSADARLVQAASMFVAEAALTGESEPVLKDVSTLQAAAQLGDRSDMVFSGTAVTRGRGRAVVTQTGMATEVGRIAGLLEGAEGPPTPLQLEMHRVGRILGLAVTAIAIVVVGTILLTSDIEDASDVVDVMLVGVSLAVAAVPEGLPAVLSVVLAMGVQRMAARGAIVKELSSVETLGSASAICTDKTGTLTRNEMTIQVVVTRSGTVDVTGTGYLPNGELLAGGEAVTDPGLMNELRVVLCGGSLTNDAVLWPDGDAWAVNGDPTDVAFLVAERKAGFHELRADRFHRIGEVPFTSERKLMSTLQADDDTGLVAVVTKGAPDVLLARCDREQVGSSVLPLSDERRGEILAAVDALGDRAMRTLAVAYRPMRAERSAAAAAADGDEAVEQQMTFAGVVGILDPARPEARQAIAKARGAGIRVLMITGDHPRTAARIAADLGIIEDGGRTISGREIDELDDAGFRAVVRETSVFARVAPEHKLRIVAALQADGDIVAMTGDGVNDAPALKRADIGVAMGITGTDVSKEAARMILADDDFSTIVAAVREGRGIFANIRVFLRYLLSSNVGEVLTMFFGVLAAGLLGLEQAGEGIAVPLLATQILWINLLTDSAPALAMSVEPPPDDVMSRPPRRLTDRVIDRPMQAGIVFVGVVMAIVTLLALDVALPGGLVEGSSSLAQGRTMAFTTLVLAQLFNCFNARSERESAFHHLFTNRLLWSAIGLSLLLQVAVVHLPFLNDAFDTIGLDAGQWLLCTGLASVVLWAAEIRKLVLRRLGTRVGDHDPHDHPTRRHDP